MSGSIGIDATLGESTDAESIFCGYPRAASSRALKAALRGVRRRNTSRSAPVQRSMGGGTAMVRKTWKLETARCEAGSTPVSNPLPGMAY
jgi:hypothetical protein